MKLSKEDLLNLTSHATKNLAEMSSPLHWDLHKELNESERIALAWIEAVNMVCKTDIEVEYRKEVRYE